MKLKFYDSLESTNTFLKDNSGAVDPMTLVAARAQTSGRGQRGNSWESEPGMNLTCSFYFHPQGILPSEQFAISEAIALAATDTLGFYGIEAKVKWPNDIYCNDSKICGILIEHSVSTERIERTIAGIGLNINQRIFISDAPNPVSMAQLQGDRDFSVEEVASRLGDAIEERLAAISSAEGRDSLHRDYMTVLWRGDNGIWPFRLAATGEEFRASIHDILPSGHLILCRHDSGNSGESVSQLPPIAFKEVEFIL